MAKWKVVALDTGTSVIDKSIITYLTGMGTPVRIPRVMYYLEGPKRVIVDTSAESPEVAERAVGENLTRRPEQEPAAALRAIGVEPESIDAVILTHLHWDHCGNNRLFSRAKLYVQADELRYAWAPSPAFAKAYLSPQAGFMPPFAGQRFELLEGPAELWPGLRVMPAPGHSPGLQVVLVETNQGVCCAASDAVMSFENLEKMIPPGFHYAVDPALRSMQEIARLADVILPGHDYSLFAQGPVATVG